MTKYYYTKTVESKKSLAISKEESNNDFCCSLKYGKGLLKNPTEKLHGDGDGTVNINSLQACRQWKDQQKHAFHEKGFINLNHGAVTEDEAPIEYILKVLGAS